MILSLRRLRPDHMAGQIALLVLAAIILFDATLTGMHYLRRKDPLVEPNELIASGILALDFAEKENRLRLVAEMNGAAPWINFSLRNDAPEKMTPAATYSAELADLTSRLWNGADISKASTSPDKDVIAVRLRKGGYAIVSLLEPRRSSQFGSSASGKPADPNRLMVRLLERSAIFFFLCATILVVWVSSFVAAPLVNLAREAERFPSETSDRDMIAEAGPLEVRNLARALNRMQRRIQTMIEARSHALAAVSHDLRTIITRVRLRSEFIPDESIKAKMLQDVELMEAMLRKNLQHLRESHAVSERSLIDLGSVIQTVSDQFKDLGHDVVYQGGKRQIVIGSITDLQRIFSNLIENAVIHGKRVIVTVGQASSGNVRVDVSDDGPGIPESEKARVLEPFVRRQPARNMNEQCGFGLGLSIVQSLVKEAGGSLQLLDNKPQGLIARVILPNPYADEPNDGAGKAVVRS